jgi:hypothetical protein
MQPDPQSQPRRRRRLAILAVAVAALAIAVPASASLAGGDGGTRGIQSAPVQEQEPRQDRPERRGGHDCPFERGGDGGSSRDDGASSRQDESSLPL